MSYKVTFEQTAGKLAEMFTLDASDVRRAYQDKPDSLQAHFNAASGAQADKSKYIVRAAVSGVVGAIFWPVLAYTAYAGYKAYENHGTLNRVGEAVRQEVENFRARPAVPSAPLN